LEENKIGSIDGYIRTYLTKPGWVKKRGKLEIQQLKIGFLRSKYMRWN